MVRLHRIKVKKNGKTQKSSKDNLGSNPVPSLAEKNPVGFVWDPVTIQNGFSFCSGGRLWAEYLLCLENIFYMAWISVSGHIFLLIQALFLMILFDFLPVEMKWI